MAKFRVEVTEINRAYFIVEADNAEQARTVYMTLSDTHDELIASELEDGYEGADVTEIVEATDEDAKWYPEIDDGEER